MPAFAPTDSPDDGVEVDNEAGALELVGAAIDALVLVFLVALFVITLVSPGPSKAPQAVGTADWGELS